MVACRSLAMVHWDFSLNWLTSEDDNVVFRHGDIIIPFVVVV